jgi:hypothetical protein
MATVRELIKMLADCDPNDDVYVNVLTDKEGAGYIDSLLTFQIDGLENRHYEYRGRPTFVTTGRELRNEE